MDPNATLRLLREAMRRSVSAGIRHDREDETDALLEVREHLENLDKWLTSGGFLPEAWAPNKAPSMFPIEPVGYQRRVQAQGAGLDVWIFKVNTDRGWMRIEVPADDWRKAEAGMLRRMLEHGREVKVPWHIFHGDGTPLSDPVATPQRSTVE